VTALSSATAGPAQVSFSPDGAEIVVTEKATSTIDVYPVLVDGTLGAPTFVPSQGMTPFGFDFGRYGSLIVSEAFGGAPNGSAVSSYRFADDGGLELVSGSVATTETAACWIALTHDGRFAYATNAGSGTVTGYRVAPKTSALSILDGDGVTGDLGPAAHPIDAAVTRDDRWLYVLSSATGEIAAFRVRKNGSLEKVPGALGLPATSVGLAAR
jgi:6-phosphogluconolactonase (cycloisomerase 2 family)